MQGENGGPKTTAGKTRSRTNAVKHGLRAASPVVRDVESEAAWTQHLDGVIDSLQPDGHLEEEMAARIAALIWRLRRVTIYETERISGGIDDISTDLASETLEMRRQSERRESVTPGAPLIPEEPVTHEKIDKMVRARLFPDSWIIENLMRYESHLHRQYIQTLHELEAMQSRRHGERTPLARLDITGSPA